MANLQYDFGTFYLTVYSPLLTGTGANICTYSIWCHFEDVELEYPAVAQSGFKIGRARGGASTGKVDVSDAELRSENLHSLSGGFARISNAASIASEIPLISAVALPTAWVTSILSRAAEALGFSKPSQSGPSEKRTLTTFPYMNNVNAVDNSIKIALRSDNHVAQLPGFAGTDIDEMAFSHFLSIPSYISAGNWTTGQAVGTPLAYYRLGPTQFGSATTVSGVSVVTHPVMGYVANHFMLYRGSITVTIKIVKTEFHSGRILIAFFPGVAVTAITGSFANSQNVFREVLDLRTASEISITFPYTSLTPYLKVDQDYGLVSVFVVNPLVAPDQISTSVSIISEVAAGPDFEFAVPVDARAVPVIVNPQSGVSELLARTSKKVTISPQSGSATAQPVVSVMDGTAIQPSLEPALYCIGERILSIRQLIKRFCSSYVPTTATTDQRLLIDPHTHYVPTVGLTLGVQTWTTQAVDMVSYYAVCFRFARGGMRFKYIDPGSTVPVISQVDYTFTTPTRKQTYVTDNLARGSTVNQPTITLPNLTGGAEYEVPFYSQTHAIHVSHASSTSTSMPREDTDNPIRLAITQAGGFSKAARVYKAAADDYSLGFFIGTVPIATGTGLDPVS
jgi:hypothetical protein